MEIYDAENQILGRMCSVIAKRLLEGESVAIVNAERAVLSGRPKATIETYQKRVKRGDPIKGPFFPRTPDGIVRRAVRGMLPMKKPKGKKAYKKIRVFIGVPDKFKSKTGEFKRVEAADTKRLKVKSIEVGELSVALGTKKRW